MDNIITSISDIRKVTRQFPGMETYHVIVCYDRGQDCHTQHNDYKAAQKYRNGILEKFRKQNSK